MDSYCWPRQELHVVGRQMPPVHHSDRCAICEIECPILTKVRTKLNGQSSGACMNRYTDSACGSGEITFRWPRTPRTLWSDWSRKALLSCMPSSLGKAETSIGYSLSKTTQLSVSNPICNIARRESIFLGYILHHTVGKKQKYRMQRDLNILYMKPRSERYT